MPKMRWVFSWVFFLPAVAGAETVEGEVALPASGIRLPKRQHPGYLDRIPNPITELRPYDPRPECVVVLDMSDGQTAVPAAARSKAAWSLGAHAFSPRVLPIVSGQVVVVQNQSRKTTHPLVVPESAELMPKDPVGPGGTREIMLKEVERAVVIGSLDLPHLEGRVVALRHRVFALIDAQGRYRIDDVPPGRYTARIWYRDGWLPGRDIVEVGAKGTTTVPTITLPLELEPKAPAADSAR